VQLRKVVKPQRGYIRVNGNPGPLRLLTGPNAGRIVPTRPAHIKEITCARCGLVSYPGLPPFVKALGFDRKTGEAIEQYVHERCPRNVAANLAIINSNRERDARLYIERLKLPRVRPSWKAFVGMFRR
jgi:hypothetical protein